MTALKINLAKFKEACIASRKHMEAYDCKSIGQHRMSVQWDCEIDWTSAPVEKTEEFTADDLRGELNVASRAAGLKGATPAQMNFIVSLAEKSGDFRKARATVLSKFEASMMIDSMKKGA